MAQGDSARFLGMRISDAATQQGISKDSMLSRIRKGWSRRQCLGLDPPPGVMGDMFWKEVMAKCDQFEFGEKLEKEAMFEGVRRGNEESKTKMRRMHMTRYMVQGRELL